MTAHFFVEDVTEFIPFSVFMLFQDSGLVRKLIDAESPLLYIPNLAIHFTSGAERSKFECNNEINLRPILASYAAEGLTKCGKVNFEKLKAYLICYNNLDPCFCLSAIVYNTVDLNTE